MADRQTELALPSVREVFEAFVALSPQQCGILIGIVLWGAILAMPLSRIDRRDRVTQATYAVFMAFAGTALVLAANKYLKTMHDAASAGGAVAAFAGVASFRWFIDKFKPKGGPP